MKKTSPTVAFLWPLAAACGLGLASTGFPATDVVAESLRGPPADPQDLLEQKVTGSDGIAGDLFGLSVAIDGSHALVGAPNADVGGNADQGVVYVFDQAGGTWTQVAELIADDGAPGDGFGTSVALSGDTALVGAYTVDIGGNSNQGAAYVFDDTAGTWSQSAKLVSDDGAAFDNFGNAVALDGSTAVIGAVNATVGGQFGQGAAYVFDATGGAWNQTARMTATEGMPADSFGTSVALDGDTALVSAPFADIGGMVNQGAVYVFARAGVVWNETQQLAAADGADFEVFGNALAVDGSTAVIGEFDATVGGNDNQGAAYVFTAAGGTWSQAAKLTADDGVDGDQFGSAVAISGDGVLVGAPSAGSGGQDLQGAAYRFDRSGAVWSQTGKFVASDGATGDHFATAVALAGTTALAGVPNADPAGNPDQGAAYFYLPGIASGRVVDDFESGNPNGWGWINNDGANGSINPEGGHPGAWMDSGLPYYSDHPNLSAIPPTGSALQTALASATLNSAAFDFQRLDTPDCFPFYDLPSTFTLEFMDLHSDPGGAVVEAHTTDGPPSPGATSPWQTVAFTIPSDATDVPPGWVLNAPPELNYTWQELMHNIDGIRFFSISPDDITYDACWRLGADNVILSYGDAAPADTVFADGFEGTGAP